MNHVSKISLFALLGLVLVSGILVQDVYGAFGSSVLVGGNSRASDNDFIFAENGDGYNVWTEDNVGFTEQLLMFAKTTDGGASWSTPLQIDTTTGGFGYTMRDAELFVEGSTVSVIYQKETGGGTQTDLMFARSTNGGTSFGTPVQIYQSTTGFSDDAQHIDGNNIVSIIEDQTSSNLLSIVSTNGGTSFDSPVTINDGLDLADTPTGSVDVLIDGTNIFVAFEGTDNSNFDDDIFYVRSTDTGSSYSSQTILSTTGNEGNGFEPVITKDGADVTILFSGDGGAGSYLSQVQSTDTGATFGVQEDIELAVVCLWNEDSSRFNDNFVQDGQTIHAFCVGDGNTDAMYSKTTDLGDNWGTFVSISDEPTWATQPPIGIGADGNVVVASWVQTDAISEFDEHVVATSGDGGSTWNTNEVLTETTDNFWELKRIGVSGENAYITLLDDTNNIRAFADSFNAIPVITRIGGDPVSLNVGETYTELGATCTDAEDGNITGNVVVGGDTVDMDTAGTYNVTYDCQDSAGQDAVQVTREVQVQSVAGVELTLVDIMCEGEIALGLSEFVALIEICPIVGADPPVITLIGDAIVEIATGGTYTELGATAFDNGDGDVTGNIVIGGDVVNTSVAGAYFVTYDVSDSVGNDAVQVIRTVVVSTTTGGGGGSGTGGGQSVGNPIPPQDLEVDDLSESLIQDLLDQLAPSVETTIVEEIIQTFFEFQVIDKEHDGLVVQSFLPNEQLGIRWSTGDDIVVASVVPASSPFTFAFEQVPVVKTGSGSAISENSLTYNLQVPSVACGEEVSFECVAPIRYSVPVTVNAIIDGVEVSATGTILVDLTVDELNPVLIILFFTIGIPIVAGIVWKAKGGHNPSKVSDLLKN